jgi:hypothetical protein
MKVRSLIAAVMWTAVCAGASSAFAGGSAPFSDDDSSAVFGPVNMATLQSISGGATLDAPSASVGADALRGVSGNLGVNLAAGALNAQANQIALVTTPQAEIASQQITQAVVHMTGGSAVAELGAGALAGMSGNIGINIAAGAGNAQFNGMIVH